MSQTMKKDAPEHAGGDLSALRERVEGSREQIAEIVRAALKRADNTSDPFYMIEEDAVDAILTALEQQP